MERIFPPDNFHKNFLGLQKVEKIKSKNKHDKKLLLEGGKAPISMDFQTSSILRRKKSLIKLKDFFTTNKISQFGTFKTILRHSDQEMTRCSKEILYFYLVQLDEIKQLDILACFEYTCVFYCLIKKIYTKIKIKIRTFTFKIWKM